MLDTRSYLIISKDYLFVARRLIKLSNQIRYGIDEWPYPNHPALRLIHLRRASVQTPQQGAQGRLVPIRLRSLARPNLAGVLCARDQTRQAPQPGAHRADRATVRRPVRPVRPAARRYHLPTRFSP